MSQPSILVHEVEWIHSQSREATRLGIPCFVRCQELYQHYNKSLILQEIFQLEDD